MWCYSPKLRLSMKTSQNEINHNKIQISTAKNLEAIRGAVRFSSIWKDVPKGWSSCKAAILCCTLFLMLMVIFDALSFDLLSEQVSKDQSKVRLVSLPLASLIGAWVFANLDQQLFLDTVGNFFVTCISFNIRSVSPQQQLGEKTSKQWNAVINSWHVFY